MILAFDIITNCATYTHFYCTIFLFLQHCWQWKYSTVHDISNFLHRIFWVCYFLISSSAFCIEKIEIKTIVLSFLILVMLFASKLLHQSHMTNVKCPYETFFKCHFFPLKKLWTKKCILWIDLLADQIVRLIRTANRITVCLFTEGGILNHIKNTYFTISYL